MRTREQIIISLRGLRLCEYDWDGAGGLPMRGDVADTAFDLFEPEGSVVADAVDSLPAPLVSLNTNGTVDVEFDCDPGTEKGLFLTFECQGVVTYIKVFGDGQTTVEGVTRIDPAAPGDDAEMSELFAWATQE